MIGIKKLAVALAAGGTALGLIGMGLGASFTDGASATQTIKVGTFGITVAATNGGVVTGSAGSFVVTLASPDIQSSVPGTAPLTFSVTSIGSMPAVITVTKGALPTSPFTDLMLTAPTVVTLAKNVTQGYSGGIGWPMLVNTDLGKSAAVIYTIKATEVGAPAALADGTVQVVGNVVDVVNVSTWKQETGAGGPFAVTTGDKMYLITEAGINLVATAVNGKISYHGTVTGSTHTLYLVCPGSADPNASHYWYPTT